MAIPKPLRVKDKAYLAYITTQPWLCIGTRGHVCVGDVVYHHTVTRKAGGSDYLAVPLCGSAHPECHTIGRDTFQQKYNLDFRDEIIRLLSKYIGGVK